MLHLNTTSKTQKRSLAVLLFACLLILVGLLVYFFYPKDDEATPAAAENQNAYGSVKGYQAPVEATPERVDYAQPEGNDSMHFTIGNLGNVRLRPRSYPTRERAQAQAQSNGTTPPGDSSSDLADPGPDLVGLRTQGDANLQQPAKTTQLRSLTLRAMEYACFRAGGAWSSGAGSSGSGNGPFQTQYGGVLLWVYLPMSRGSAVLASLGNLGAGKQACCLKYTHGEGLCATVFDKDGNETAKVRAKHVDLMDNAWHLVGFMLYPQNAAGDANANANETGLRLYNDGMEVAADALADTTLNQVGGDALCINRTSDAQPTAVTDVVPVMYVSNLTFWRKPIGPIAVSAYYANGQRDLLDPADITTDTHALGAWWKLSDREGAALPASHTAPGTTAVPGKVLSRTQAGRAAKSYGDGKPVAAPSSKQIDDHPPRDTVYAKKWAVVAFAKPGPQTTAATRAQKGANAAQKTAFESPHLAEYLQPNPRLIAQQTSEYTLQHENQAARLRTPAPASMSKYRPEVVIDVNTQPQHNNDRLDRDAWQPGETRVKAPMSFVY